MEKRYQVFVSSTYEDLQEERREVMQTLLPLDCIPTGMELFPAADEDSWTLIKRFISECDYYIVIVGGRYGSVGPNGKSYTEMEYDYAIEAGLPVLAFLHKYPGKIPVENTESSGEGRAALAAFREKIEAARHAKHWTSPKELAGSVVLAMTSLMKTKPRIGWVRADRVPSQSTAEEILALRRKIDELEKQVAETAITAPAGSEEFARGEEPITVHFDYLAAGRERKEVRAFTWNNILATLGPVLIVNASEQELKEVIEVAFRNTRRDETDAFISNVMLRDEDFQKIKLQLRALGLIREHKDEIGRSGWTLTPYGDRQMTQVAALRSSAKA